MVNVALALLKPHLPAPRQPAGWTAKAPLPGGDFPVQGFEVQVNSVGSRYPFLPPASARRLARAYGTLVPEILRSARSLADLGRHFGAGLTEAEVRYLMASEWAMTAADIVWRRSKLGLRLSSAEVEGIDDYMISAQASRQAAQ